MMMSVDQTYTVAAMYKFAALPDFETLQAPLQAVCRSNEVMGTILLAEEGLNGTVAGPKKGIEAVIAHIQSDTRFENISIKYAYAEKMPFHRMKVRLKKEIVTLGKPVADPNKQVGTYVKPEDWNDLISDPDVILVDTRNEYEVAIGTFRGAEDPKTASFREFPEWVEALKARAAQGEKPKVAMFCTGGIRCEKASSYMKTEGFEDVYHLEGGILKYLENVPAEESLWEGECFVFDQRVSVEHGLTPGSYDMCHACRRPISEEEKAAPEYQPGVSCPHCYDASSPEQKARFISRQKQIDLAKTRNEKHLGARYDKPVLADE
jgi:UPF0176 protein